MTTDTTVTAAAVTSLTPLTIAELGDRTGALRKQVAHAFIGQTEIFDQVLLALLAGGHVLIEGVPGLGKTLLVRALAASIGCTFGRIQFTPDLMPADVTGHAIYDPKSERFQIRRGPVFANLLLADEINRAPARTQAALLESMQEGQVTIEGRRFALPAPFMVVATQNPIEQEGTYPLPEAQLDRFLIKVVIGYPTLDDEKRMVANVIDGKIAADLDVSSVHPVMGQPELLAMQQGVAAIRMDAAVTDYAVRIVRTTREWPGVIGGAGPRGGLALARLARAQAAMEGRDFVTPDDVRAVALPALRHRLLLAPEALIERQRPDDVLAALLHKVPVPRQ
jgi:MoxR-like ATPase